MIWGKVGVLALLTWSLVSSAAGADADNVSDQRKLDPRVQRYFAAKEKQARQLTEKLHLTVADEVWDFYAAATTNNWDGVEELYKDLATRSGQYTYSWMDPLVRTPVWQTVNEAYGAFQAFSQMNVKFVDAFGKGIIDSIPRGSVYFGGTDAGRWIVTALCKSHAQGEPFFTLTQNALADGGYLEYLRAMYGSKLAIPSDAESKEAFEEYAADARERKREGRLKPGENFSETGGRVSMSGAVTVFAVGGNIARRIFDQNPDREFFIEESTTLDWMYPHLTPRGLILKINRKPPKEITDTMVRADRQFWRKQLAQWIGDWLTEETSLKSVNDFAERIYARQDFKDFKGDKEFVTADRRYSPQKVFGKLRSAQAAVYAWRADHAEDAAEKKRMGVAADFAFRQAFALCPFSSDGTLRYVNWLAENKRPQDAKLVATTAVKLGSNDRTLRRLAEPETE